MKNPQVAVVLLNWNGLSDTLECLESLSQCSYAPLSVYVIDNGSREKIARIHVQAYEDILGKTKISR